MTVAEKIKEARKRRGWTQGELAERCAVSVQAVSQWESGKTVPGTDRLREIAKALGVYFEWLMGFYDKDEAAPPKFRKEVDPYYGKVPLINLSDAEYFASGSRSDIEPPVAIELLVPQVPFYDVSFALTIKGDDYLSPIRKNDIIIFENRLRPTVNDIVLFTGALSQTASSRSYTLSDLTLGQVLSKEDSDGSGALLISALDEEHRRLELDRGMAWRALEVVGVAVELRRLRDGIYPRWD